MNHAWPQVQLGSIADFRNGLNYTQDARRRGGLPIVGVKDFQSRTFIDYSNLEQIDPDSVSVGDTLLAKDDILFVRSNGNRDLIGRSLIVDKQPVQPTTYSGFTIRLRIRDSRAYPRFFAYLLRGPIIRKILSSQGGGTNISNLNQGILSALSVPLPPPDEQRRIASILSAYDDLIEVNRRRVAILEDMARRLFKEWFVHLRFPGHATIPLHDTSDGPVPEGWTCVSLGRLVAEQRDAVSPTGLDPEIMYVGLEHLPRRSTTLIEWGKAGAVVSMKLRFRRGDVLFGKIRPYFHKVAVAPSDGVSSTDAIVLRSRAPEHAGLVAAVASSDAFVAQAVQTSNGTKMPRANWGVLAKYPVRVPPPALLHQFNTATVDSIELANGLAAANRRLAAARDLLLSRLLSGQHLHAQDQAPMLLAAE